MIRLFTSLSFLFTASAAMCVTVSVNVSPARCGLDNGSANATASGGIPPYSYSWSNGGLGPTIGGLTPGDYTVTVIDGLSNTAQATGTVFAVFEMGNMGIPIQLQPDCQGMCTGIATTSAPFGGTQPYNYPPNIFDNLGQLTVMGLCAGMPAVFTVTDVNGCPGTIDVSGAVIAVEPAVVTVQATAPACEGQSNGSMTIVLNGPAASYVSVVHIGGGFSEDHYPQWGVPYTINNMPAGGYDLISTIPGGGMPLCTAAYTGSVPQIDSPCGGISGRVYHDADQDCVYNGFDLAQPYRVITIDPVGAFAISDGNGNYQQNLNYGNYDLSQTALPNETQICPAIIPQPLTIDAINNNVITDFANLSSVPHDLVISIWSSAARPGFPTRIHLSVTNNTAFPSGDVTVDLTFDPLLLNPSPASANWNLGTIAPYANEHFHFEADVPANINLLGTVMNYTATVTNTATESSVANNTASLDVTITGSYDPNDKQGNTSSALSPTQYFLAQDEWIDYTVRFQNTGTATAETVVIRDTIDTDLFIPSLEILGASHTFTPSFGFEEPRELIFTFNNINLPDSTTDLLGSQGFISYRIKPNGDIIVGDELENTAGIYFDFNPPIITNTVTHVVELSTRIQEQAPFDSAQGLRLLPNPTSDVLNVVLATAASSYEVITIDGRHVHVPGAARGDGFQLDVRALPAGTYLLRVGSIVSRFTKY